MNFSWSLSALTLFEACKFAYKCRYVLKIEDKRPPGGPAQRGIDTHKEIELFLREGQPLSLDLGRKWGHAFNEIKKYPIEIEHRIALTEAWEPTTWEKGWLKMVLDLRAKKPAGYSVYDWKTGKEYDEHFDQKELYALGTLAEKPEEKSISSIHVYLDLGKQTKRDYHRDQMHARRARWEARVAKLRSYLADINGPGWIMEPNFRCRFCAFSKAAGGPCKF